MLCMANVAVTPCFCKFKLHNITGLGLGPDHIAGSGPGSCSLATKILQLAAGWCACTSHPTSATPPQCSLAGLQLKFSHTTLLLGYRWLLKNNSRHWHLSTMQRMAQAHPTFNTIRPSMSTTLCYDQIACFSTACCPLNTKRAHLNKRQFSVLPSQWWNRTAETQHIFCRRL